MSTQSTQPFSDVSQPGADLEQLVASLHADGHNTSHPIDLALVRIFARCHRNKRYVTVATYPDGALATTLDHDMRDHYSRNGWHESYSSSPLL